MSVNDLRAQALAYQNQDFAILMNQSTMLREKSFGREVELCAIINARSGHCGMDCAFCSQSAHHGGSAPVFDLLGPAQIHDRLRTLEHLPLRHVGLVTSGGALGQEEVQSIAETLLSLPDHWKGKLCASLGRLDASAFLRLTEAGLGRYHHNLESSPAHYARICTTQSWQQRRDTVSRASAAGLQVCCGGLFGLGESWEDRVDFALALRELNVQHVPINFLHPQAGTPLAHLKPLEAEEALRIIAMLRHVLPTATLRVCGGRPLVLGVRQGEMFAAGANALMTGDYLTTTGKAGDEDCRMVQELGLEIVA